MHVSEIDKVERLKRKERKRKRAELKKRERMWSPEEGFSKIVIEEGCHLYNKLQKPSALECLIFPSLRKDRVSVIH